MPLKLAVVTVVVVAFMAQAIVAEDAPDMTKNSTSLLSRDRVAV